MFLQVLTGLLFVFDCAGSVQRQILYSDLDDR